MLWRRVFWFRTRLEINFASALFAHSSKLQLAILLSTNFVVQLGLGAIIVVLPVFADSLGLGAAGVGLLVALPQVAKLILQA